MTTLTKDEVLKLARKAGFLNFAHYTQYEQKMLERFAHLCRADLVAEVERLKATANAPKVEPRTVTATEASILHGVLLRAGKKVGPLQPNNDEVICPNCTHQFRAIPVNVQMLMTDGGIELPFFPKEAK